MIKIDGQDYINVHEVCEMIRQRCPRSKFSWQAVSTYIRRGKLPKPKYNVAGRNHFDPNEVADYIEHKFILKLRD